MDENDRFELRINWPTEVQFSNPAWELYGHYMNSIHISLKEHLESLVEAMRKNYNKKRKNIDPVKNRKLVMLNEQNIRARHICKKPENMMRRPSEVLSVGRIQRHCKLKFPESWKIHPTSNIDLLEQYQGTNPKKQEIEIGADGDAWVM